MSFKELSRHLVIGGAAAAGLTLGVAALAGAATTPDQQAAAEQDNVQEPSYNGSIEAPEGPESQSEADEAKALEALATITPDEAEQAARVAVPDGTVNEVELEDENGSVVYGVEMTDADGSEVDVKIDAGDGTVLGQENEADEGEEDEADEADESETDNDDAEGDEGQ
jgi:uncharacterized membrane protein YkoI